MGAGLDQEYETGSLFRPRQFTEPRPAMAGNGQGAPPNARDSDEAAGTGLSSPHQRRKSAAALFSPNTQHTTKSRAAVPERAEHYLRFSCQPQTLRLRRSKALAPHVSFLKRRPVRHIPGFDQGSRGDEAESPVFGPFIPDAYPSQTLAGSLRAWRLDTSCCIAQMSGAKIHFQFLALVVRLLVFH